jgi:hypothetical protein
MLTGPYGSLIRDKETHTVTQQKLSFDSQCSRYDVERRSRELLSDRRGSTASVT